MDNELKFELVERMALDEDSKRRMFGLMTDSYNHVNEDNFRNDLEKKDLVGLIKDADGEIFGFTTFAIDPGGHTGEEYHIVFSGDTVLDKDHWGSQVMLKGWCHSVGRMLASDPAKPWYWCLLSKGHRTFMYLPLFFKHYYPSEEENEESNLLKEIIMELSPLYFNENWKPKEGVVRFRKSMGELKPGLYESVYQKKGSSFAKFFLDKNPGFYKGEELVCMTRIHPDNMRRHAYDSVLKGMLEPLSKNQIQL